MLPTGIVGNVGAIVSWKWVTWSLLSVIFNMSESNLCDVSDLGWFPFFQRLLHTVCDSPNFSFSGGSSIIQTVGAPAELRLFFYLNAEWAASPQPAGFTPNAQKWASRHSSCVALVGSRGSPPNTPSSRSLYELNLRTKVLSDQTGVVVPRGLITLLLAHTNTQTITGVT